MRPLLPLLLYSFLVASGAFSIERRSPSVYGESAAAVYGKDDVVELKYGEEYDSDIHFYEPKYKREVAKKGKKGKKGKKHQESEEMVPYEHQEWEKELDETQDDYTEVDAIAPDGPGQDADFGRESEADITTEKVVKKKKDKGDKKKGKKGKKDKKTAEKKDE